MIVVDQFERDVELLIALLFLLRHWRLDDEYDAGVCSWLAGVSASVLSGSVHLFACCPQDE